MDHRGAPEPSSVPAVTSATGLSRARLLEEELNRRSTAEIEEHLRAGNTRAAYESAWRSFQEYCRRVEREPFPAEPTTVRLYISWSLDGRTRTVQRPDGTIEEVDARLTLASVGLHLAAIAFFHRMAGHDSPTVSNEVQRAWEAARRAPGRRRDPEQKHALRGEQLRPMLERIRGNRLLDIRDRALLLICFHGALRRSELCGMTIENVTVEERGLRYRLHSYHRRKGAPLAVLGSKTNQFGEHEEVLLPADANASLDPVRLYRGWIEAAGITSSFVWRSVSNSCNGQPLSPQSVRKIVRGRILGELLDQLRKEKDPLLSPFRNDKGDFVPYRFSDEDIAAIVKHFKIPKAFDPLEYGAHSLRSGLIVTARKAGHDTFAIRKKTRHKTETMIERYSHSLREWDEDVSRGLL